MAATTRRIPAAKATSKRRSRLRDSRRRRSQTARALLSLQDPRRTALGHHRPVHLADRGGARPRPRHHGQSVSLYGDVSRVERVLPAVDSRRRAGEVRRAVEGSGHPRALEEGPGFRDLGRRARRAGTALRSRAPAPRRTSSTRASGSPRSRSCAATRIRWTPASTSWPTRAATSAASSTPCPKRMCATVMRLPWVAMASDGSAINLDAPGVPHPRNYSTAVRVLGHYVRDEKVLSLPEAVRKMTSLPARILGLDRSRTDQGRRSRRRRDLRSRRAWARPTRSRNRSRTPRACRTCSSTACW